MERGQKNFSRLPHSTGGEMLIYLMIIVFLFTTMMLPVISGVAVESKAGNAVQNRELALQIAEAGVDYYQWHLAHFTSDYMDGNSGTCGSTCGPYTHAYVDKDTEQTIGTFSLVITPPTVGSTLVTIKSTGYTTVSPSVTRTITARYGIPSLALFSLLSNSVIWVGSTSTISGQMMSNNGIRFDGDTNAPVMSAKDTYTCQSSNQGSDKCPHTENGVWSGLSSPPSQSFWDFPVGAVAFSGLTLDLADLKDDSETASGLHFGPSGKSGYSLTFKSDGTVDVQKVNTLASDPIGKDSAGVSHAEDIDYATRSTATNYAIPANGIIFLEDNVWVQGTVEGRAIVVADGSTSAVSNIYIPTSIVYHQKDGSDVLGLVAQNSVIVTYGALTNSSVENMEIDAAMVAQTGVVGDYNYFGASGASGMVRDSLTIYGSNMSYGIPTWATSSSGSVVSGFENRYSNYDPNLIYGPPPSFPLSANGYQQVSWTSN